jgi:hypothetical protein
MCCPLILAALLGPRLGILVWWLIDPQRWASAFDSVLWPILGVIFLPWTTLAYVLVYRGGVDGLDWVWIVLGLIFDLGAYSGGGYKGRRRFARF